MPLQQNLNFFANQHELQFQLEVDHVTNVNEHYVSSHKIKFFKLIIRDSINLKTHLQTDFFAATNGSADKLRPSSSSSCRTRMQFPVVQSDQAFVSDAFVQIAFECYDENKRHLSDVNPSTRIWIHELLDNRVLTLGSHSTTKRSLGEVALKLSDLSLVKAQHGNERCATTVAEAGQDINEGKCKSGYLSIGASAIVNPDANFKYSMQLIPASNPRSSGAAGVTLEDQCEALFSPTTTPWQSPLQTISLMTKSTAASTLHRHYEDVFSDSKQQFNFLVVISVLDPLKISPKLSSTSANKCKGLSVGKLETSADSLSFTLPISILVEKFCTGNPDFSLSVDIAGLGSFEVTINTVFQQTNFERQSIIDVALRAKVGLDAITSEVSDENDNKLVTMINEWKTAIDSFINAPASASSSTAAAEAESNFAEGVEMVDLFASSFLRGRHQKISDAATPSFAEKAHKLLTNHTINFSDVAPASWTPPASSEETESALKLLHVAGDVVKSVLDFAKHIPHLGSMVSVVIILQRMYKQYEELQHKIESLQVKIRDIFDLLHQHRVFIEAQPQYFTNRIASMRKIGLRCVDVIDADSAPGSPLYNRFVRPIVRFCSASSTLALLEKLELRLEAETTMMASFTTLQTAENVQCLRATMEDEVQRVKNIEALQIATLNKLDLHTTKLDDQHRMMEKIYALLSNLPGLNVIMSPHSSLLTPPDASGSVASFNSSHLDAASPLMMESGLTRLSACSTGSEESPLSTRRTLPDNRCKTTPTFAEPQKFTDLPSVESAERDARDELLTLQKEDNETLHEQFRLQCKLIVCRRKAMVSLQESLRERYKQAFQSIRRSNQASPSPEIELDVYIDLKIIARSQHQQQKRDEAAAVADTEDAKATAFQSCSTETISRHIDKENVILVDGLGGSGKTTFCRRLCARQTVEDYLCVFIRLRDLFGCGQIYSVEQLLLNSLPKSGETVLSDVDAETISKFNIPVLFVLDGFDEVQSTVSKENPALCNFLRDFADPVNRRRTLEQLKAGKSLPSIEKLVRPCDAVLIASRPDRGDANYNLDEPVGKGGPTKWYLESWSSGKIKDFCLEYFNQALGAEMTDKHFVWNERAEKISEALSSENMRGFSGLPLMASMLCQYSCDVTTSRLTDEELSNISAAKLFDLRIRSHLNFAKREGRLHAHFDVDASIAQAAYDCFKHIVIDKGMTAEFQFRNTPGVGISPWLLDFEQAGLLRRTTTRAFRSWDFSHHRMYNEYLAALWFTKLYKNSNRPYCREMLPLTTTFSNVWLLIVALAKDESSSCINDVCDYIVVTTSDENSSLVLVMVCRLQK